MCVFSDRTMALANTAAAEDACPFLLEKTRRGDTVRETRRRDKQHLCMFFFCGMYDDENVCHYVHKAEGFITV